MCYFYTLNACYMKKVLLSLAIVCLVFSANAQRLLSWTPEFPVDNSTLKFYS